MAAYAGPGGGGAGRTHTLLAIHDPWSQGIAWGDTDDILAMYYSAKHVDFPVF